jgi:very-short-patch-repair endonuclease
VEDLIVGSEALAARVVTRQTLRTKYIKVHHNVYARMGLELDAAGRARAAWLWSRREATLVGTSAAAMHGTLWLPNDSPAELSRTRRSAPRGIVAHSGIIPDDEICLRASIYCTTPARTAYDIGRRTSGDTAIIRIDALLNATRCGITEVERIAHRYPGARGIRSLRKALDLADGGAESPKETELRLLLVRDRLPRPVTQIRVGKRRIDMGWPNWMVGVEYDGEHHFTNPNDYANDIERLEYLAAQGWLIVRVSGRQLRYQPETVVRRVREALVSRGALLN